MAVMRSIAIATTASVKKVSRSVVKILKTAEAGGGPDVKYHYAAALARSGQPDEARRVLKILLESSQSFSTQADARALMQELSTG